MKESEQNRDVFGALTTESFAATETPIAEDAELRAEIHGLAKLVSVGETFTTTDQYHRPEVQSAIHADEMARADRLKAVQEFTAESVRLNPAPDFHDGEDEWPESGPFCATCGKLWGRHLGIEGTCGHLLAARAALKNIESYALDHPVDDWLAAAARKGLEATE